MFASSTRVSGARLFDDPTFAQLHSRQLISSAKSLTCRACWLRLEIAQNCRAGRLALAAAPKIEGVAARSNRTKLPSGPPARVSMLRDASLRDAPQDEGCG